MLNYLWAAMLLVGIVWGMATGHTQEVNHALIDGGGEAVSLCVTMLGVMGMWCGMMEIAKQSGLVEKMTVMIRPFIRLMFPRLPAGHQAESSIALNMIANILGLGWAATPAGLQAMEDLARLECERGNPLYCVQDEGGSVRNKEHDMQGKAHRPVRAASNEMCTFLVLNISSLQLIPVNMIAYRSQYGSANPAVIVGPAILATLVSTMAAAVFCRMMDGKSEIGAIKNGRISSFFRRQR